MAFWRKRPEFIFREELCGYHGRKMGMCIWKEKHERFLREKFLKG
jgi:hypothetical protein